jgi:hypothetical protein
MSDQQIPEILKPVLDSGVIEADEVSTLRRWFYGDGLLHREDAEGLFQVQARLGGACEGFNRLFIEAVTDFVVYQNLPTGKVTVEQADWLIGQLGGPDAVIETRVELDLLLQVLEEAHAIPASLAAFALAQVRHAAITGEGPAASGRVHFSRTVDAGDIALLTRILDGARGPTGIAVSRAEADILFDIADACQDGKNDGAWDMLFTRAIASHMIGSTGAERSASPIAVEAASEALPAEGASSPIDGTVAAWLSARIHRDGRISRAEEALLRFAEPMAAADPAARAAIVRMA